MKKITALILALLMLLGMLFACSTNRTNSDTDASQSGDVTSPGESQSSSGSNKNPSQKPSSTQPSDTTHKSEDWLDDRLPTDLSAYNGKTVKILGWRNQEHQTIPKADSAQDPLKSTLYHHWRGIEDRFGITLQTTYTDSETESSNKFLSDATADNANYDLIQTQPRFSVILAEQGYLCNLKNLSYPDLGYDANGDLIVPWWPDSIEEYSQHGALYFISSNSSAMTISQMEVVFVNTPLVASKGLSDPVTSAVNGSWTVDEMTMIVFQFRNDASSTDNKLYGLTVDCPQRLDSLYYACGFRSVVNDANGVGTLGYDSESERNDITSGLNQLASIFRDFAMAVKINETQSNAELRNDQTALFLGTMEYIREIQDLESWTVVPLPKRNSAQEGYVTSCRVQTDMWCIPVTTRDPELSGMILEANACSEYNVVAPFFFTQYLKERYANGAIGKQCFGILREGVLCDLGAVTDLSPNAAWRACFYPNTFTNSFSDNVTAVLSSNQTLLNQILISFEAYKSNGFLE